MVTKSNSIVRSRESESAEPQRRALPSKPANAGFLAPIYIRQVLDEYKEEIAISDIASVVLHMYGVIVTEKDIDQYFAFQLAEEDVKSIHQHLSIYPTLIPIDFEY